MLPPPKWHFFLAQGGKQTCGHLQGCQGSGAFPLLPKPGSKGNVLTSSETGTKSQNSNFATLESNESLDSSLATTTVLYKEVHTFSTNSKTLILIHEIYAL